MGLRATTAWIPMIEMATDTATLGHVVGSTVMIWLGTEGVGVGTAVTEVVELEDVDTTGEAPSSLEDLAINTQAFESLRQVSLGS
jgi:hypothetical protein